MEVILLEDIKGLGKRNDIKNVAPGFARNFLLPRKLVDKATPLALKKLIEERARTEEEHKRRATVSEEDAKKVQKFVLRFELKTGKKNEVFGSVSAKEIEHALGEHGIDGATALLEKPIKKLGEQKVEVDLGGGVHVPVKVLIEVA